MRPYAIITATVQYSVLRHQNAQFRAAVLLLKRLSIHPFKLTCARTTVHGRTSCSFYGNAERPFLAFCAQRRQDPHGRGKRAIIQRLAEPDHGVGHRLSGVETDQRCQTISAPRALGCHAFSQDAQSVCGSRCVGSCLCASQANEMFES